MCIVVLLMYQVSPTRMTDGAGTSAPRMGFVTSARLPAGTLNPNPSTSERSKAVNVDIVLFMRLRSGGMLGANPEAGRFP
jgi:hypothetical protein